MKPRDFLSYLAIAVVILLALGGGLWVWFLGASSWKLGQGGVTTQPVAALFVPRQSPVMVSLQVNPEKLEALGELAAPLAQRRRTRRELQQLKQNLLAKTGLEYDREIKQWLGDELSFAVTSLDWDRNPDNGTQAGYLWVVEAKKPELAKDFLQATYSGAVLKGDRNLVTETYQGVKLLYEQSPSGQPLETFASAVVGDYVLFANQPQVLRDAINTVQVPDLNLQNSPAYQQAIAQSEDPHIAIAYVNLPFLSAWLSKNLAPEDQQIQQFLAVTLATQGEGLRAETTVIGVAADQPHEPRFQGPGPVWQYLPDNSFLAIASEDLNGLWHKVQTQLLPQSPIAQLATQSLQRLNQILGVDVAQDIFPHLQGEYALALVPKGDRGSDWLLITEKSPQDSYAENLDQVAKDQGLSVGQVAVETDSFTVWASLRTADSAVTLPLQLDTEIKGVHTSWQNYEIFSSSIELLRQVTQDNKQNLGRSPLFRDSVQALPSVNDGYVYLNWETGGPRLEEQLPLLQVLELVGKPWLDHVRTLTLSSEGSDRHRLKADLLIRFR